MAKGDVTLKFDADTAAFIQKVMAARTALDETTKKARESGDEVSKAGDKAKGYAEKMSGFAMELVKLTAVPTTIMGVVELALQAAERRVQRLEHRADAVAQRSSSFGSSIYGLGAEKDRDRIDASIQSMTGQKYGQSTFSPTTAENLFKAIRTGAGDNADVSRTLGATAEGLRAMGSGANEDQAAQLGTGIVNLMSLIPGMGAGEAADLSHQALVQAPGMLTDKANIRLIARAKDRRQMMKMLIAAERAEVSPKVLTSIQNDMFKRGRTLDDAIANPNMLPPEQRVMMKAITDEMADIPAISGVSDTTDLAVSGRNPGDAIAVGRSNEMEARKARIAANPTKEVVQQELRRMGYEKYAAAHPDNWFNSLEKHEFDIGSYDYPDRAIGGTGGQGGRAMVEAMQEMVELLREQGKDSKAMADEIIRKNPMLYSDKPGQK